MDGRGPTKVLFASWNESERNLTLKNDKNKVYRGIGEEIVNIKVRHNQAIAKLDGIDLLVLGLQKEFPVQRSN